MLLVDTFATCRSSKACRKKCCTGTPGGKKHANAPRYNNCNSPVADSNKTTVGISVAAVAAVAAGASIVVAVASVSAATSGGRQVVCQLADAYMHLRCTRTSGARRAPRRAMVQRLQQLCCGPRYNSCNSSVAGVLRLEPYQRLNSP